MRLLEEYGYATDEGDADADAEAEADAGAGIDADADDLYADADADDDEDDPLDGEMRDVVAKDAWSVGAIIYYTATGEYLVPDGPKCQMVGSASCREDRQQSAHHTAHVTQ